jgi:hypothetical protein
VCETVRVKALKKGRAKHDPGFLAVAKATAEAKDRQESSARLAES